MRSLFLSILFITGLIAAEQVTVSIPAGEQTYQSHSYTWAAKTFQIAPPSIKSGKESIKKPKGIQPHMKNWIPWPGVYAIKPKVTDSLMLGCFYKTIIPDSIVVSNAAGKTFTLGKDYELNAEWGQIASLDNKLGKGPIHVDYKYRLQRLDLVQVNQAGVLSIKTGKEVVICPALPQADADHCPVAGIYVHPFYPEQGKPYSIDPDQICPINPKAFPVYNKDALTKSKALLDSGKQIKIALLGDSITLGAESGQWWNDRSKCYTGLFVAGLKNIYNQANIKEIPAYQGGITTKKGTEFFKIKVAPQKPDLLLIALGANDASGPVGKPPKVSADAFKQAVKDMVQAAKTSGSEVILVTPFGCNPFIPLGKNLGPYRQALIDLANEEQVACADVNSAWSDLRHRGIAPYSQVHNWINHPGAFGHTVYADCILALFQE